VAAVVGERDRLHQRHAEVGGPRDAGGHLGDLDRMGEPGAEVVVLGGDEHLALAGQPSPRPRVLDPVEVALEAEPQRVGRLLAEPASRADRSGRARRQRRRQLRFTLLAAPHRRADERLRAGVRTPHQDLGGHRLGCHRLGTHRRPRNRRLADHHVAHAHDATTRV
jgi:hypothetical protein